MAKVRDTGVRFIEAELYRLKGSGRPALLWPRPSAACARPSRSPRARKPSRSDGRLASTLRHPYADGTPHLVFEPLELLGGALKFLSAARMGCRVGPGAPGFRGGSGRSGGEGVREKVLWRDCPHFATNRVDMPMPTEPPSARRALEAFVSRLVQSVARGPLIKGVVAADVLAGCLRRPDRGLSEQRHRL